VRCPKCQEVFSLPSAVQEPVPPVTSRQYDVEKVEAHTSPQAIEPADIHTRYPRQMLLFGVLGGALMLLACGGLWLSIRRPLTSTIFASESHNFDEWVSDGDLLVKVYVFCFDSFGSEISVWLWNKNPNEVAHWRVWEFGPITDEHGNEFFRHGRSHPALGGPYAARSEIDTNTTELFALPSKLRVDPGETGARLSVFYEPIPLTSKRATIKVTTSERRKIIFQGQLLHSAELGHRQNEGR
jgi:hypothetical protein